MSLTIGRKYLTDVGAIVKIVAVMDTDPLCYIVEVINNNGKNRTWPKPVDIILIALTGDWRILPD